MRIFDPLLTKVTSLALAGQPDPLKYGRLRFGSPNDYEAILSDMARSDPLEAIVIDFCPFSRLGATETLLQYLPAIADLRPVILATFGGSTLADLHRTKITDNVPIAVYNRSGHLEELLSPHATQPTSVQAAVGELVSDARLLTTRKRHAERLMLDLLADGAVDYPHPRSTTIHKHLTVDIGGRWFMQMPNGMYVSCLLNLKHALAIRAHLLAVAYEVIYWLFDGFAGDAVPTIDLLVTSNNTALLVSSVVQCLAGIQVACIDKMGPLPTRNLSDIHTSIDVAGRRVCIFADVTGTGAELDRTAIYLAFKGAKVAKVVVAYQMEAGEPLMMREIPFVSLCKPKRELGYIYRTA